MAGSFHIFAENDFGLSSRKLLEKLKRQIQSEDRNYLLNVNRTEYVNHIVSQFEILPLGLEFDKMTVSSSERMIPAEAFPLGFTSSVGSPTQSQL